MICVNTEENDIEFKIILISCKIEVNFMFANIAPFTEEISIEMFKKGSMKLQSQTINFA